MTGPGDGIPGGELEPLASELEALLRVERTAQATPVEAQARVMARLAQSGIIGPGSGDLGSGGGAPPSSGPASVGGAGSPGALAGAKAVGSALGAGKLLLGVGLATFTAGGMVGAGLHAAIAKPAAATAQAVTLEAIPPAPLELEPIVPSAPLPQAVEPAPPRRAASAPRSAKPAPLSLSSDDLAEERGLIEMARTALGRGKPADALFALDEHGRRFSSGQLVEEREALTVQALVSSGELELANARAAQFKARFPRSLLTPVVDAALEAR